ncbi:MAG: shikimate dehydrogenase [Bacteroidales bacterium]|nr:shikimate dehydrogenase [Bacteroidales bacterium]
MRKFGLIGYPLGHSFSKAFFTEKFRDEKIADCSYDNYPIEDISQLPNILKEQQYLFGLNVTIPYKEKVFQYLDEIDHEAQEIGAINTIKIVRSGNEYRLKGFNTDAFGFEQPLLKVMREYHRTALILGTGGASKAVAYILKKHNIKYKYVSRVPKSKDFYSYEDLDESVIKQFHIIINTSPLGMYPNTARCPDIPYGALTRNHILYDLIYNPEKTLFLKKGEKQDATVLNGLPMLKLQADKAWEIWNT